MPSFEARRRERDAGEALWGHISHQSCFCCPDTMAYPSPKGTHFKLCDTFWEGNDCDHQAQDITVLIKSWHLFLQVCSAENFIMCGLFFRMVSIRRLVSRAVVKRSNQTPRMSSLNHCTKSPGGNALQEVNNKSRFQYQRKLHASAVAVNKLTTAPRDSEEVLSKSPFLTLCKADKAQVTKGHNPLVLFFPWLGASKKAKEAYCSLYHERGWDVLVIQGAAKHFLWPSKAQNIINDVQKYVLSPDVLEERSGFMVHSMSLGSFLFTVFTIEIQDNKEKYQSLIAKIQAQIFDSIVIGSLSLMGQGIADSLTKSLWKRLCIRGLVALYFSLTKKFTVEYYDFCVRRLHNDPLVVPTFIYYSQNDPLSSPEALQNFIGHLRSHHPKMDLSFKCWAKSGHAAHLRLHEEEYVSELASFLERTNLTGNNDVTGLVDDSDMGCFSNECQEIKHEWRKLRTRTRINWEFFYWWKTTYNIEISQTWTPALSLWPFEIQWCHAITLKKMSQGTSFP